MAFPWALAATAVGSLFGSGSDRGNAKIPDWLLKELRGGMNKDYDFSPDSDVFMDDIDAKVAQILAKIPVAEEAFNADAASRGVFGSPEALKNIYSDVYSPITRDALSTMSSGLLGLESLKMEGKKSEAHMPLQYANILGGIFGQDKSSGGVRGAMGDISGAGFQALLFKELGLFD